MILCNISSNNACCGLVYYESLFLCGFLVGILWSCESLSLDIGCNCLALL